MLLPLVASADDSGTCGSNLTWTYVESTGTLTISGTGAMWDYSDYLPWVSYNIKKVILEDGITSIGGCAFRDCSGLTSVTIPNSVTGIGEWAFQGCSGLTSVTIPNSVTDIGERAFQGCSGMTAVTIGNSVTSIGNSAFHGCSSLATITIPNSVTTIGNEAFRGCSSLTALTIGNSVTSIGYCAFEGCSGLTSVTIGNSVTSIGYSAFSGCSSLTSVTIPNSVTSIGSSAFSGCSSLTAVNVESGNIKYDSRENCNAIIETETNTLITGCQKTIIPNSVTSIGYEAFRGCSGLTSVTIPNSVTSIGSEAFQGCSGLISVTIPNSVTRIGGGAFYGCSSLTSVTIPNSVTSIGEAAFNGSGLTSVTIPNSVTSIGVYAFSCSSLLIVNSKITEPFNCRKVFNENTCRNGTLYIPKGTKELYTRFDGWREFLKIVEAGDEPEFVWLNIKGAQGVTKIKTKKGTNQEMIISPEEGWKLLSVTMDGTDVTDQIKDGAIYTTPAINSDATIIIVYEQEASSDARAATHSQADIKVVSDGVVISDAAPDTRCIIYSSDGQQVVNTVINDGTRKIALQQGQVYILTINGRTLKFAL